MLHRFGLSAAFDGDTELLVPNPHVDDPPRDDLELAQLDKPFDTPRDFGRYTVAMDVPPWANMAQEAPLLRLAEALPDGVAVRPQAVDCGAPADRRSPIEQPAPQPLQRSQRHLLQGDRRHAMIGMGA